MQHKRGEQQEIIVSIILTEAFAPQKDGINDAQAVNDHGQQEKMSIGEPGHAFRLNQRGTGARGKFCAWWAWGEGGVFWRVKAGSSGFKRVFKYLRMSAESVHRSLGDDMSSWQAKEGALQLPTQ